nr:hypothetical protein CFP56_53835 [Quercus suber]
MSIIEGNVETSSNSGDGWGNQGAFCNMLYYDSLASLKRSIDSETVLVRNRFIICCYFDFFSFYSKVCRGDDVFGLIYQNELKVQMTGHRIPRKEAELEEVPPNAVFGH